MNTLMNISNHLTIGIPVRIDSKERKDNLHTVTRFLSALQCRILIIEADVEPHVDKIDDNSIVEYQFIKDDNKVFHRTYYINLLLQMATTEVMAIWDADVLVDYHQIVEALNMVMNGATISYPYDGRFIMLPEQLSTQTRRRTDFEYLRNLNMKSFLGRKLCGGAYLVHRMRYLECGGENERFTGWGPEDAERQHRVVILGHKACHILSGELFHLYHPRGCNSNYQSKEDATRLRNEFVRVCCMLPSELKSYISK